MELAGVEIQKLQLHVLYIFKIYSNYFEVCENEVNFRP